VRVTLHSAHNPFITQLLEENANVTLISVNLSLSHIRSQVPLGPFPSPTFLDYVLGSGKYQIQVFLITPFMTFVSFLQLSVPVIRLRLHACEPPLRQGSGMQKCTLSIPALPILNAILISPLGPYTTQLMVFAKSKSSLLPPFASTDKNSATTVRIGHSVCDIVTASDAITHAGLNDFGVGGGFAQVLRLKTFAPAEMITSTHYAASDAAVSAAGSVLTTSSDAVAKLLQVEKSYLFSLMWDMSYDSLFIRSGRDLSSNQCMLLSSATTLLSCAR
jgi:hypothetical protein